MNPKIIFCGYARMAEMIKVVIKKVSVPSNITVEITDLLLEDLYKKYMDSQDSSYELGSNCVLVGGEQASYFLKKKYNVPVIPIKITGFDLMKAMINACQNDSNVVLVNFYRKLPEIEECQDILKIKFKQFVYHDMNSANRLFKKLRDRGVKVVIGASLACDLAEEYGIKGCFLYSQSAMQEALEYAINLISSYQKETERAETLKTIVDFTHSGIIGTDQNFKITTFNPAAEKIIGLKSETVIGKNFTELFPDFLVSQNGKNPVPKYNSLGKSGATKFVSSSLPIIVDGQPRGQVTVLQDTASIQIAEETIRREITRKRFTSQYTFSSITGKSHAIRNAIEKAKKYGCTNSAILITGETGTGKEMFAQSIHNISHRKNKPFVAINCAALPETLLDSELFGYEQGAFTGTRKGGKPGLFEMAHTGTIFLDEIGEISPALQARLLRVLQEKEVMHLGGDRLIPVDVRVISATNRNLLKLVQEGNFREDLYYRLGVLILHIPTLKERKEDINLLIHALLRRISPQMALSSGQTVIKAFSDLKDYSWPGNVRELENILERFAALANDSGTDLTTYRQLLLECYRDGLLASKTAEQNDLKVEVAEEKKIRRVLEEMRNNKTHAAKALGISRATLYRKIEKMKIE